MHEQDPWIETVSQGADYRDWKSVYGRVPLDFFVANVLKYWPVWFQSFRVPQVIIASVFSMRLGPRGRSVAVPMTQGDHVAPFKVVSAQSDSHWIGKAEDKNLVAHVVILASKQDMRTRFDVGTFITFRRLFGRLYFQMVRPFHHLVLSTAMAAAVRNGRAL